MICKYFLPFGRLPFCSDSGFLHCAFACLCFGFPCLRRHVQKDGAKIDARAYCPYFLLEIVFSGLIIKSLIHLSKFLCMVYDSGLV